MADEVNNRGNEAEEANNSRIKEEKGSIVVEEDTEESEEEALVYDRASGETSEDSENEQDDTVINGAASDAVEHVQEQIEDEKRKDVEEKGLEETLKATQNNGQVVQGSEENKDEENESEEDKDGDEELEWKEEEVEKVTSKGREEKSDPTFVPRDTRYFLHDDRYDDELVDDIADEDTDNKNTVIDGGRYDEVSGSPADSVDRWTHDLYVEEEQGPRTEQEKERDRYRYERSFDRRGRRGGYDHSKRRRDNQDWNEEDFPKLNQARSYPDGKRQSYPPQDRSWSKNRDQDGNQRYGNRDQQYRGRDFNGDRRYEGGNQENKRYGNRDQEYGSRNQRYGNKDQQYRNKDQQYGNRDQQYRNREQQYGNRDQQYRNREQQYGNRDQQYGNGDQQYGSRGHWHQEGNKRDQKYPTRDRVYENKEQHYQNRDMRHDSNDQHRNNKWKFEDDWGSDKDGVSKGNQISGSSWDDDKISSYNLTLKATTTTATSTSTNSAASTASSPATTDTGLLKKSSPRTTGGSGAKLLFVKSQTSSHPTRVFSLKKGRGAGSGSGSALLEGQGGNLGDMGRGRGRGRGTKPIINVAPPKANSTGSNEAPPIIDVASSTEGMSSSTDATPTRNAEEEAESCSETVSSNHDVSDEQFEDAETDNVNIESKKETVKPKRYSSQRQKPGEEVENKQSDNTIPAAATGTGGSKVGLLPTPNFDQQQPLPAAAAGGHPMMGMPHQNSLVQQMLMAQQQHAVAAAQYMGILQQQQQQQSHVMPAPADVMIDGQSNVIPPAASTANTHAHNQRELGPFHWMTPTVAAATTYPGHFAAAGLYGNLHMQQLFQPTFQQQGLAPPPQLEGEMGVAGGLFIPPMDPDQQRLMQQRQQLAAAHKQSQAVPIVDPKLTDTEP